MGGYLVRRLLQVLLTFWVIGTLVFFLVHLTPGGPVVALAGEFVTREYQEAIERLYGLDRPLIEQYVRFLTLLSQGELGQSYTFKRPVLEVMLDRLPPTLLLMAPAILASSAAGIWGGLVAARRHGGAADTAVVTSTIVCYAVPIFWLGQLLLLALAAGTGWFPTYGMTDVRAGLTGWRHWLDVLHHLALPALTLTLHQLAFTVLITRSCLCEEMSHPYFVTALSKGLSVRRAQYRHALPNALLPVITLVGNRIGWLLAGAVLVENVFAWPGFGRLVVTASLNRDYPLIMGVVLLVAALTLITNLVVDLIYTRLDPRIGPGNTDHG